MNEASLHQLLHDPRISTFGKMLETQARLEGRLGKRLEMECGISHSWFEILLRVGRSPERRLKMSELASQVALTTGGITRVMDRMIGEGLLERLADPKDRRVQFAHLTARGIEKLNSAVPMHVEELQTELFDRLSPEQTAAFDQTLDLLRLP
jgi:MarR family transcriptional regulator, 2-MHQ and catechol-resistance regulon repressor